MNRPRIFVVATVPAALREAMDTLSASGAAMPRFDVVGFGDVPRACRALESARPHAVLLLLRGSPEHCLQACLELQKHLEPKTIPLGVIFPSTDPSVWQQIYASGANMFLPWHGAVIQGLPTYVGTLLRTWHSVSFRSAPPIRSSESPSWSSARGALDGAPTSARSGTGPSGFGQIILDEGRCAVDICAGSTPTWHAEFTPVQFRILHHLVQNEGRLVSKRELAGVLSTGLRMRRAESAASVYQHISQIRKKLGPHAGIVRCIRSRGYVLDASFVAA